MVWAHPLKSLILKDYLIISPNAVFSPICVIFILTQSLGLAFGTTIL